MASFHPPPLPQLIPLRSPLFAPPAEAQAGLLQNRVDYVVVCNGAPELKLYRRAADGGLAAQLAMGNVPAFLQPVALGDGPLRAWRFIGAK